MKNKILILDIETTGFLNKGGLIVEVGAVDLDIRTGVITKVFDSLLREGTFSPRHEKEPYGWIFRNSNLKYEDVLTAPPAKDVFKDLQVIIDKYELGCTAFNSKFDFDFLENRGIVLDKKLPCPMLLSIDICKLPGRYPGKYKWPKVEEAYSFFFPKREYVEAHRGCDDAAHEAEIVYELIERGVFEVPSYKVDSDYSLNMPESVEKELDKVFKKNDTFSHVGLAEYLRKTYNQSDFEEFYRCMGDIISE